MITSSKDETSEDVGSTNRDGVVLFAASVVILLWIAWGLGLGEFFASRLASNPDSDSAFGAAGEFGDMFGSINALFTALAFVAVWWTGRMQRRELELQRREFRMQREALNLQRDELAETRTVLQRQTFESMFFQMLRMNRETHTAIRYRGGSVTGAGAMRAYAIDCRKLVTDAASATHDNPQLTRELVGKLYEDGVYVDDVEPYCGPYFRSLYHLYKLIDQQRFRTDVKRRYANIARAQLSENDLIFLAANCCSSHGAGFRKYIERYGVLKHYPQDGTREVMEQYCYDSSAFASHDEPEASGDMGV